MKKYTNPEMELYFVIVDVITTSRVRVILLTILEATMISVLFPRLTKKDKQVAPWSETVKF